MGGETARAERETQRTLIDAGAVCMGHALTHWYPATFYLLLPLIGREFDLSYAEVGFILTCQYMAGAATGIPGGLLVDTIGHRGVLMGISLLCIGVPYLLMAVSSAYWTLLACSMLIGIGNNFWHPTAIPWLAEQYPDRKGLIMALHGTSGNVGDALAPLIAGALLMVCSWREVVIVNIVPGILLSAIILILLGRIPEREDHDDDDLQIAAGARLRALLGSFVALLTNRTVLFLSIGAAFRSMTQSALLVFLPIYLAHEMGYSALWVGAAMFALQAAGLLAAPIAGHLSDSLGRRQIVTSSMVMTAVVLAAMLFTSNTRLFVYLVAVLGFFLFSVRAVLQAWLLDACPRNVGGSAIGVLFCTQFAGSAIGPVCAGLLADSYGIMSAFYFLGGTIIVANLLTFFTPIDRDAEPHAQAKRE